MTLHYMTRFANDCTRKSMEIIYVNYAQGAKNTVTVDINRLDPNDFVLHVFGQVVLEAGPKQSHLCAS